MNLWPVLILAAGLLAYGGSLWGPFVFDDRLHLVDETRLQHLWPIGELIGKSIRPVADLTFAVNYALGGTNVFRYHLFNLAIHLGAGCMLFGILRRTFLTYRLKKRYGKMASSLSGAAALLWVVHPLNTQAVMYVIQRAELLMGFFYLSTLYCLIRFAGEPRKGFWKTGAIACCALGMGSKAIMVTAPAVVFLYDAVFLAGSWKETFRQRGGLYGGLAATWGILLWMLVPLSRGEDISVGASVPGVTAVSYALTQPEVILHYVRLSFWPQPLVFDYNWPIVRGMSAALLPGLLIGGLLGITLFALRQGWPAGFLGAWFFGILAPTSSFFPIADCAFEYRVYLSLVSICAGMVVTGYEVLKRVFGSREALARMVAAGMVVVGVGVFSGMTIGRHFDYKTEVTLWQDTVRKRPGNWRAQHNLGRALEREEKLEEAIQSYRQAIRLKPDSVQAYNSLGATLARQGKGEEAIESYRHALGIDPNAADVHSNLGVALGRLGRVEEARKEFEEAIRINPNAADAHNNLGMALGQLGRLEEAREEFEKAIGIEPDNASYRRNLATALEMLGRRKGEIH